MALSNRERILATIRGEEVDRFPVWLKAGPEMIEASGCDRMTHCGVPCKPHRPHVSLSSTKVGHVETVAWTTPEGDLTSQTTTDPVGNTSLADGRTRMASKCLIGGTNATLWLEPANIIIEEIEKDLAQCPNRQKIFLTSAGVLPPAVTPEKAKTVVDAIKDMPCH